jgi:predicted dehydrogenase
MARIYLVGAGVIGREHAAACHLLGEPAELHVFDPSPQAIAAFGDKEPDAIVHETIEDLLASPARPDDIVVVATPPRTHAELTVRAFASGRHVLSEKPLGVTRAEAHTMLAAARAAGKHLGDCSMRFLGYEAENFIRKTINAGTLGALYHVTCRHRTPRGRSGIEYQPESRWFLDRSRSGGGVLMDWSVYDLATLFDLLEPIRVDIRDAWTAQPRTAVDPADTKFDIETHAGAAMRLTLADGQTMALSYERASCTHGLPGASLELEGLDGAVSWEWLPYLDNSTAATVRTDLNGAVLDQTSRFGIEGTPNWHHRPLIYFHAKVKGSPAPVIADARALFNFAVIQGIYAAAASGDAQAINLADFG